MNINVGDWVMIKWEDPTARIGLRVGDRFPVKHVYKSDVPYPIVIDYQGGCGVSLEEVIACEPL